MHGGPALKPKVTVKMSVPSTRPVSRPVSPVKFTATLSPTESAPTFRPKAKVNSSATTRKATTKTSSVVSAAGTSTPRAASPAKLAPRVMKVPSSSPSSPTGPDDGRLRAGSVSLHHVSSFSSLHRPTASASSSPRLTASKSVVGLSDRDRGTGSSSPIPRIRSKITSSVKGSNVEPSGPSVVGSPPMPLHPSTNLLSHRPRTASVSSNRNQSSSTPPPQFYPITTATPAANPHRFPSARQTIARASPPTANYVFQPFGGTQKASEDATPPRVRATVSVSAKPSVVNGASPSQARVDPASIPLPPNSPPASAVSFSSRSSVSRSSASVVSHTDSHPTSTASSRPSPVSSSALPSATSTENGDPNMDRLKTTLDNLLQYSSGLSPADDSGADSPGLDGDAGEGENHTNRATAKSNRKILDLEITNRSLLAINATLEATKHRQAREIRELRRKLRESRLILPPRAYRQVKSSLGPEEIADDEEIDDDDDDDDEEEEDEQLQGPMTGKTKGDEIYGRIKIILDKLLKEGQTAVDMGIMDFSDGGNLSAKVTVLSAEEVRHWHGEEDHEQDHEGPRESLGTDSHLDEDEDDPSYSHHQRDSTQTGSSSLLLRRAVPLDRAGDGLNLLSADHSLRSEDEVEAMISFAQKPSNESTSNPHHATQLD